jgi:hypothetical protein
MGMLGIGILWVGAEVWVVVGIAVVVGTVAVVVGIFGFDCNLAR